MPASALCRLNHSFSHRSEGMKAFLILGITMLTAGPAPYHLSQAIRVRSPTTRSFDIS